MHLNHYWGGKKEKTNWREVVLPPTTESKYGIFFLQKNLNWFLLWFFSLFFSFLSLHIFLSLFLLHFVEKEKGVKKRRENIFGGEDYKKHKNEILSKMVCLRKFTKLWPIIFCRIVRNSVSDFLRTKVILCCKHRTGEEWTLTSIVYIW